MKCIGAFEMADYIGGHLSSEEMRRILHHITQCRDCMERLESAIHIVGDEDLSEWEPLTKEETRAALERIRLWASKRDHTCVRLAQSEETP